jgi:hypothetical protein
MSRYGLEERNEEIRVGSKEDGVGGRREGRVNVIQRAGIGIATRNIGKIEVGYADRAAEALVVTLLDYGGLAKALKYVVRYYGFECFPARA